MKAALLCPGPSLTLFGDRPGYDIRVAVNRAAGLYAADFWICLDWYSYDLTAPRGRPVIVCSSNQRANMVRYWPEAETYGHLAHDVEAWDRSTEWFKYSATAGLVLAHKLGADQIDAFGVDLAGVEDFDGKTFARQNRTPRRWRNEARIWDQVTRALAERGTAVTRIRPREAAPVCP